MTLRVSLYGCGTIGQEIASAFAEGTIAGELVTVHDRNPEKCERVVNQFSNDPPTIAHNPADMYNDVNLVVEAAGQNAVADIAIPTLQHHCDLMVMSVGAFANTTLYEDVRTTAKQYDARIHVPSGSIAGLDSIKAAAVSGELAEVTLTTTKHPDGLTGAPYLVDNNIDLSDLSEATTVFEGSALEAAKGFPANINVAIALSLAGIGPTGTTVRIVADPHETNNVHQIRASGGMGDIHTEVRNVPSPTNPKTSYLAPLSAIATLREMTEAVQTGT